MPYTIPLNYSNDHKRAIVQVVVVNSLKKLVKYSKNSCSKQRSHITQLIIRLKTANFLLSGELFASNM